MDSVTHFEMPADNIKRAQTFYKNTFGWATNEVPGMGGYTLVQTAQKVDANGRPTSPAEINGGIGPRKAPLTAPCVTVNVPDIDATLTKITKNGGTVVQRKEKVGDMGFTGYFKDTEGNIVGLWQTAGPR
ncbi:MAG: VOC family protein [Thermoplasmatota archaeon]